jgi:hypothetical protein
MADMKDELLFVVRQVRRCRVPPVVGVDTHEDNVVRPLMLLSSSGDLLVFSLVLGVALLVLAAFCEGLISRLVLPVLVVLALASWVRLEVMAWSFAGFELVF